MPIYELDLANLGPFDEVHFEFDPHVNVFVGPNNSGKSTVLTALADIAIFPFSFPEKLLRSEPARFSVCTGRSLAKTASYDGQSPIARWTAHGSPKEWFEGWLSSFQELGFSCMVPALRRSTDYRAKSAGRVKGKPSGVVEILQQSAHKVSGTPAPAVLRDLAKRVTLIESQSSAVSDEALIQKIIDLDYRGYREKNRAIPKILNKIATIASEITDGFPIEFVRVAEEKEGLFPVFKTPDGEVPLNVLSQGTQSIIQWLGLLLIGYAEYYGFPEDLEKRPGVVIIDEIDAHMHPSWQQRILPTLSRNFPKLQIFCSSHSPLVLAGLKAGQAQLLKRDGKGKVTVSHNETDIVGWSMDEIFRNLLDVANPTDLGTSDNIDRLQELRKKRRLTPNQKKELEKLRDTVRHDLLAGPVAEQIEQFAQRMPKPSPAARSTKKKPLKKSSKKRAKVPASKRRKA